MKIREQCSYATEAGWAAGGARSGVPGLCAWTVVRGTVRPRRL
jgi:hypothetical protein